MIVLFRLIVQAVRSRLAARLESLSATSRIRLRVMPNDLDLNRHVNNGRIYSLVDLGRMDWLIRSRLMRAGLVRGWMPVVGDSTGRFIRQMKVFEVFTLETRLLGWTEKWLVIEHRLLRDDGQLAAIVAVRAAFVSGRGVVSTDKLFELIGLPPAPSPPLPAWLQTWMTALQQLSDQARQAASGPGPDAPGRS